ncbi:MAG: hypothetical protein SGILL_008302, partial [Bacillariaceae sp.]
VHLSIDLIARILTEIPQVTTVKLESLPTGQDNENADVRTDGFMTGFAFPEILMTMTELAKSYDYDKVRQIYEKYLPLIALEQQPGEGLALRKEIYRQRGLISSAHVRRPGKNLSKTLQVATDRQLARLFASKRISIQEPLPIETIMAP